MPVFYIKYYSEQSGLNRKIYLVLDTNLKHILMYWLCYNMKKALFSKTFSLHDLFESFNILDKIIRRCTSSSTLVCIFNRTVNKFTAEN